MSYFTSKDLNKSLSSYEETKKYFNKTFITTEEIEILNLIKKAKENLKTLLSSDSINELINLREELNRYLEFVSSFVYEHSEKADWVYIWRKNQMANEWTPLKGLMKVKKTNTDVEKELENKYSKERIYSMLEQKRTDYLLNIITSIQNDLRTIQLKIEDISRERINVSREDKRIIQNPSTTNKLF